MRKELFTSGAILSGALAYTLLFWQAQKGLNTLLFSMLAIVLTWLLHPDQRNNRSYWIIATINLYTATLVVGHHTALALIAHVFSWILLIGLCQARELRFLFFAGILGVSQLLTAPWQLIRGVLAGVSQAGGGWGRRIALSILPVTVTVVFFTLYYQANPRFASWFSSWAFWWQQWDWGNLPGILGLFLRGACVVGALLLPGYFVDLLAPLDQHPLALERRRQKQWLPLRFSTIGLKREYAMAMLTLSLLNGLLLSVNLADLPYVWRLHPQLSAATLSQFVHAGTSLLMLSIVLAMGLLVWFFRGNLNFYRSPGWLQVLGYTWLAQNAWLALAVGVRNYHYFNTYGLTYLRLGVLAFLVLVMVGLLSLYVKLNLRRSLFYLLVSNAWAWLLCLVLAASFNWDVIIARYNLSDRRPQAPDVQWLISTVSLQQFPVLLARYSTLAANWPEAEVQAALETQSQRIRKRLATQDWRGWNYRDRQLARACSQTWPGKK